jgi:hypothetical protein
VAGPEVAGVAQVATADPSTLAKMPAVGVVTDKTSPTTCTVQRLGRVDLSASALTFSPGSRLFVSLTGAVSGTVPAASASPSGYVFVQPIGVATAAATLEFNPSMSVIRSDA